MWTHIGYTDPCCTHIDYTDLWVANLMRTYKHYTDPWFRNPWTSHDFYYFFTGFQSLIRLVCERAVRIEAASSGVIRISGCNAVKASLSLRPAPFLHKRWSFRYPGHPVAFAVVPTLCSTVLSLATCHQWYQPWSCKLKAHRGWIWRIDVELLEKWPWRLS